MKIAFVGIPCSGKTTVARIIASKIGAVFIPEVARVLIEVKERPPTQSDQAFIMKMQSVLENSMRDKIMVSDVPTFINSLYYRYYFGETDEYKKLYALAKNHKYDLIFKLSPLPYIDDGIRYQTSEDLEEIDTMIDEYQEDFGRFIYVTPTDINERVEFIMKEVAKHEALPSTSSEG